MPNRGGMEANIMKNISGKKAATVFRLTICMSVMILFIFILTSCLSVRHEYLEELSRAGEYELDLTGFGMTEKASGIFTISALQDGNREYSFTYTFPKSLCGIKESYHGGVLTVSLDGIEIKAEPGYPTLGKRIFELFDAGRILSVDGGGTYTQIKTDKAAYCVDGNGEVREIITGEGTVKIGRKITR